MKRPGEVLREWRQQRGLSPANIAAELDTTRQSVENFENGKTKRPRFLVELAALMGFATPKELLDGKPPPAPALYGQTPPPIRAPLGAHALSHLGYEVPPTIDRWEELMQRVTDETLPEHFRIAVPDDALAPTTPRGTMLLFDRRATPTIGAGVIVKCQRDGLLYLRRYAQGVGSGWLAQASNTAYASLEPLRDDLVIIAVATWREGGNV